MLIQLSHYLITYVNYINRLMRLPIILLVFLLDEKSNVVYKTIQYPFLRFRLGTLHHP